MQTTNKSINFLSDRGNDAYTEREVIRIKLDPGSAPLVNTQDSYLTFSLELKDNESFHLGPDPALGGVPFEQITIMDGNEMTVLEQMDNVGLWTCMKNYYGNNSNDEKLQKIYEGRPSEFATEFIGNVGSGGAGNRLLPISDGGANTGRNAYPNSGGGFGNQYYEVGENIGGTGVHSRNRKVQVLYRFPMSGLLSSLKSELLPLVVLNGLVIKIVLMENAKFLKLTEMKVDQDNRFDAGAVCNQDVLVNGFGNFDQSKELSDPDLQSFVTELSGGQQRYVNDKRYWAVAGRVDNAGAVQVGNIAVNQANVGGIALCNSASLLTGALQPATPPNRVSNGNFLKSAMASASLENCPFKAGQYFRIGRQNATPAALTFNDLGTAGISGGYSTATDGVELFIDEVRIIGGVICLLFSGNITVEANFGILQGSPVCVDVARSMGQNIPGTFTNLPATFNPGYIVSNLQMVCNVVEAPAGYIQTMVNQAQSGQLKIQYNSYRDERININTGSLSNEIFIPNDLQRCYCILAVNENLRTRRLYRSAFTPEKQNLFNYQWIIDGTNIPNIPVKLKRLARGQVSPLHIIELEKALDESSIRIRNIQNPSDFTVIGRRLGAYGDSVSLLDKTLKCRINYETSQPHNLLYHFWIYHTKTIMFEGNSRVVLE